MAPASALALRQIPSGGQKLKINGTTPAKTKMIMYLDMPLL
jgi:hypothetical protein